MIASTSTAAASIILIAIVIGIALAVVFQFICAAIAGEIAHGKHRVAFAWYYIGLIFGVFGVALAFMAPAREQRAPNAITES